ncbi:MAG: glycosyltransferase family 4 protein [Rhodothermales bacterium]
MKHRVLFLDHTGLLGGAELTLLDIARHFAAESKMILFEDGPFRERLEAAGVPVEILPAPAPVRGVRREAGLWQDVKSLPGVLTLVRHVARRSRGYDVLYASSQKAFVVAALAGRLARKPVLWHLHDLLTPEHFSHTHRRLVVGLANRWTARVITNSEASARAFIASGGQASNIHVVYLGLRPERFTNVSSTAVEALRRAIGIDGGPIVSVFSRLAPWKGQHVLLEALADVPQVHALLIGQALFGEEDYAASLHRLAEALGITGRVHFLGFRDDIPELLHLSDVVLHTSTAPEPFGRVVVEGMLAGRPVVATHAGGVLEIIEDGKTGILVEPGDAHALARALNHLLSSPDEAHALAKAGQAAAQTRFSMQRMLNDIEQQIEEVTSLP